MLFLIQTVIIGLLSFFSIHALMVLTLQVKGFMYFFLSGQFSYLSEDLKITDKPDFFQNYLVSLFVIQIIFFYSFYKKNRDIPNILPPSLIDNVPIKREFVRKFLGVYLDEGISYKYHINSFMTEAVIIQKPIP